ncbi:acyl-CoA thioesterase [Nannocystaceae bacterium ST9]
MADALDELFGPPDSPVAPVSVEQRVAWGELDALGHVNHTVFLRWIENARFAWFEHVGIAALMHASAGRLGPILATLRCDYQAPVGFPDTIRASVQCVELGRSSMTLRSRIGSLTKQRIVSQAEVVIVLVDYSTGKPEPVPEVVRAAIRALEGAALHERGR